MRKLKTETILLRSQRVSLGSSKRVTAQTQAHTQAVAIWRLLLPLLMVEWNLVSKWQCCLRLKKEGGCENASEKSSAQVCPRLVLAMVRMMMMMMIAISAANFAAIHTMPTVRRQLITARKKKGKEES